MNMLQNTANALNDSVHNIIDIILSVLPQFLLAVVLVIIGFVLGNILGKAVAHLIRLTKVDSLLSSSGLKESLEEVNIHFSFSKLVGGFVKWVIVLCFLLAASDVLGLNVFSEFLFNIVDYVPSIAAAALILIATFLLADFSAKVVRGSAKAVNAPFVFASVVTRYAIVFVGVLAALSQLGIGSSILEILFTGIMAAFAIAFGLAFGLGGKDVAARLLSKLEDNWK